MTEHIVNTTPDRFHSDTLEELLNAIHADGIVDMQEYRAIAKDADQRLDKLIELLGAPDITLTAYMNAMDVTLHLLQRAVLQVKGTDVTDTGKAIARDALISQVEYLRAGAQLWLKVL